MFVLILFQFAKFIRYSVLLLYFGGFALCLFPVVSARKHSATSSAVLKQLPVDTATGKLYLLNVPASCKDAYFFERKDGWALPIKHFMGKYFDQVETGGLV
ncbi:MAG: hypothetical protein IPJ31_15100 [Bacteroidetes bacterium]|nr:hypothetical protein [Bacteroidota bacterium]